MNVAIIAFAEICKGIYFIAKLLTSLAIAYALDLLWIKAFLLWGSGMHFLVLASMGGIGIITIPFFILAFFLKEEAEDSDGITHFIPILSVMVAYFAATTF